ncbi:MAG: cadmium-translocating P-type ATPase [Acidobacteria bacterium]|nr:cadmium-translocating P-type ATPase [Acidobacteriota bacterium]
MKILEFKIRGMDCAEEVAVLKREVGPIVGGENHLIFDILRGKMTVNGSQVTSPDIIRAVNNTGMRAEPWGEKPTTGSGQDSGLGFRNGRTIATIISGALTFVGFLTHGILSGGFARALGSEGLGLAHNVPLAVRVIYVAAIVAGGWYVAPKALFALRRMRPDMNLLMTIAVIGAGIIGEWLEAALVAFLFALSLALEAWSVGRARRAVEALLDLAPPTVRVLVDGRETEVSADQVSLGTVFLVKPGDRIALDGEVLRGSSEVNQAPITGESVPVLKEAGSQVFAGTINGNGALEVRSTKVASDTTLAHIIQLVGAAQAKKAPSEQWVEKFARYYTPIVFMSAALVFLVPPLLLGGSWQEWTYRALVLLVIGCPCALVISTPVSIVAALAASARNGVLIKGGAYVEAPARLKAIAMDKTGTLTEGRPRVTDVLPEPGISEHELLETAATMELQSDHPLARAILDHCQRVGIRFRSVSDFKIIQGKGAEGEIEGRRYWLGSHRYLEERGEETPEVHERLEQLARSGQSVVVIGDESRVVGMITLADAVRPASREALRRLRAEGIEHIVMLTGDNRPTAEAIAQATGVDEVHAELLPQDKVAVIEKLVDKYGQVAMIGDGVNDAPAMARATLGISMGAMGSDAAIEASDVALMSDDLSKIPWLVRHSRRALSIIRQNISLSLAVKALFVALTFVGFASLWAAIAADMGVSLLVIFNALRLLRGTE